MIWPGDSYRGEQVILKFTWEEEENGSSAFLEIFLTSESNGKILSSVCRKPSNTNITIKKKSNHSDRTKKGIIKGYSDRARALCDTEYLERRIMQHQRSI